MSIQEQLSGCVILIQTPCRHHKLHLKSLTIEDASQVIKLISQVIADFASGEISQQEYQFDTDITLQQYLDKSFYKTATLIAASCKSAAAFSDVPVEVSRCIVKPLIM